MESNRQKKIAAVIQQDLVDVLQRAASNGGLKGVIISVSKVNVTVDLSVARVYLSIFPSDNSVAQIALLQKNSTKIKYDLSVILKKHLRKVPELAFFLDDSLDYIDSVEDSINNPDNPIK